MRAAVYALVAFLAACATPEQRAQQAAASYAEQLAFTQKMVDEVWSPACVKLGMPDRESWMKCVEGMHREYQASKARDEANARAAAEALRRAGQNYQRQPIPSSTITPTYTRCTPGPSGAVNCVDY